MSAFRTEVTIACVLKMGGDYTMEQVLALRRNLREHVTVPFRFVCLTDSPDARSTQEIEFRPLRHRLPGWWSKIELFREFQSCFYLDLDTVVVRNIDDLVMPRMGFWALRDFSFPAPKYVIGSGLMAWEGDWTGLYNHFMTDPVGFMEKFRGDQDFIQSYTARSTVNFWQDHFPDRVVSYKFHVMRSVGPMPAASIVCFHGKPRPWHVSQSWQLTL